MDKRLPTPHRGRLRRGDGGGQIGRDAAVVLGRVVLGRVVPGRSCRVVLNGIDGPAVRVG